MKGDGNVYVIDFDKAELHASEGSKAREMYYLKDILDSWRMSVHHGIPMMRSRTQTPYCCFMS